MRNVSTWFCSLALILLFAGFTQAQISSEERVKVFNKVWETINEKYYDPNFNGVNWKQLRETYRPLVKTAKDDNEFYAQIKQMVSELGDAHTSFRTPQEVQAEKLKQNIGVGLWVGEVEGKTAIFGVAADSEAARAGLQPGMILTAIDGRDTTEVLAEKRARIKSSSANAVKRLAYARLLGGDENTPVKLKLLDQNGQSKEVTLVRRVTNYSIVSPSQLISRRLPSGVGYIRFDEFNSAMFKQYKKALEELKDTKGLIIDLRLNRGGSYLVLEEMAERLFGEKVSFGKTKTRSGKMPKFFGISLIPKELFVGDEDKQIYSAPIVVLVSNYSASAAEHFASGLQESGRARILGEQTCGCLLGVIGKTKIKDAELRISQVDFVTAKGKRIEGVGVAPDITVVPTISDLQTNFTRAVTEAEKLLNSASIAKSN